MVIEEEEFDPMLNIVTPDFKTRMRLYMKPTDGNIGLMTTLLIADTLLAITYLSCQISYVINGNYDD